jgi:hypothetical protein
MQIKSSAPFSKIDSGGILTTRIEQYCGEEIDLQANQSML